MEQVAHDFISTFFDVEMAYEWDGLRDSLRAASPAYQESVRTGLAELIAAGDLTVDGYWELTQDAVDSADEGYAKLRSGYEFLFGQSGPPGD